MNQTLFFCLIFMISMIPIASAESLFDEKAILTEIYIEYPRESYLAGIGKTSKTKNFLKDKRIAEVMSRVEIARQIKVSVKEETLDIACEGSIGKIFTNSLECKNEFVMIIEQSVDEVLVGPRIVSHGEKEDIVYAVAVLPRIKVGEKFEKNINESVNRIRESIEKAKKGDRDSLKTAQEEYVKAVAYDKEKEQIEGIKSRASEVFKELEKEIVKLKETNK